MRFLHAVPIGRKIGALTAILLAFVAAAVASSLWATRTLAGATDVAATRHLEAIRFLALAEGRAAAIRSTVYRALALPDTATALERRQVRDDLRNVTRGLARYLVDADALPAPAASLPALLEARARTETYGRLATRVTEAAIAGQRPLARRLLARFEDTHGAVEARLRQAGEEARREARRSAEAATAAARIAQAVAIAVLLLAIVAGLVLTASVIRGIEDPIKAIRERLRQLTEGEEAASQASADGPRDEVEEVTGWVRRLIDKVQTTVSRIGHASDALAFAAAGMAETTQDTRQRMTEIRARMQEVAAGADTQMRTLADTTRTVLEMSNSLQDVATNLASVSQGSRTRAQSLATAADTLQRMTDSLHKMAADATDTVTAAAHATTTSAAGRQQLDRVTATMAEIRASIRNTAAVIEQLNDRGHNIGQIVGLISGIASQTNLLALNAAIEAARAGENGRGFAVVAEEVRKLAQGSAQAAERIANLVQEIKDDTVRAVAAMERDTDQVQRGVEVVREAGEAFAGIESAVQSITARIEQINTQTQVLSAGAAAIDRTMDEVVTVSERNAEALESVTAATQQVTAGTTQVQASIADVADSARDTSTSAEDVTAAVQHVHIASTDVATGVQTLANLASDLRAVVRQFRAS